MRDVPYGSLAAPQDVTAVTIGRDCVEPSSATLDYLHEAVVADSDGSGVRLVPFDQAWAAAQAGTVQMIAACAR